VNLSFIGYVKKVEKTTGSCHPAIFPSFLLFRIFSSSRQTPKKWTLGVREACQRKRQVEFQKSYQSFRWLNGSERTSFQKSLDIFGRFDRNNWIRSIFHPTDGQRQVVHTIGTARLYSSLLEELVGKALIASIMDSANVTSGNSSPAGSSSRSATRTISTVPLTM